MRINPDVLKHIATAAGRRGRKVFVVRARPGVEELDVAASVLGLKVPESYVQFCCEFGVGDFNDDLRLLTPGELYAFDMNVTELDGLVVFATDGLGNKLAFDPGAFGADGESPVLYCCHDPFGIGVAAPSFASFIQQMVDGNFDYEGLVEALPSFRALSLPAAPRPLRPWWKLW